SKKISKEEDEENCSPEEKVEDKAAKDESAVENGTATNGLNGNQNGKEESDPEPELTQEQKDGAFSNFRISPGTVTKLKAKGINYLFPIQSQTFNYVYDGEDVIAQARTGTGKTLSFALPLVERLQENHVNKRGRPPKVLVMAPTRELAKQVCNDFESVSDKISTFCIYGGTPYYPQ
ncbi:nucleolar RNA helicase 2-like, partial [Mizuhopecten yessoensis]|uniref:nucleolar RNA helicase 2-like n=1 Tax=Mizuhopecten yessoensis TaxID=6573 RepID=UPI000B4597CC